MSTRDRRELLATPYRDDHRRSVSRKAAPPKDLLRWFLEGFRAEIPDRMHQRDVWRDRRTRGDSEDYDPVGGSLLGTPRAAEPFRAYIEDTYATEQASITDAGVTAYVKAYARPMRDAIARVAGRGHETDPYPFMARALYRTALRDGDWDSACGSLGVIEPVRRVYIQAALRHLWERYEDEPRPPAYKPEIRITAASGVVPVVEGISVA